MAISIFLDTNVFLSFYHFSKDDLQELEKLLALIKTKEVSLILPEQTLEEFKCNREVKIKDAINKIHDNSLNFGFPRIFMDFKDQFQELQEALKSFEKHKHEIEQSIIEKANNNQLDADILIQKLFKKSFKIETTKELVEKAKIRFDLGKPPGKNKSYGDALNWESLLSAVDQWQEFYFISDDKDYYSVLDPEYFNSYLYEEWCNKINSDLHYYRRLSHFLKEKYPHIKIAAEYEKDTLIQQLSSSSTFARTHNFIRSLREFDSFTDKQVNDIVYAAISNNQIYWIADDPPIKKFMQEIYDDFGEIIDEELLSDFISDYDIYTSS